jgi:fatty acid desaturase
MDLPRQSRRFEWPTLALYALTYCAFALLTIYAFALPTYITIILLSIAIALHSSLQHETLHMLEPRWPVFGYLIGYPALGLAIPYDRFRDLHLAHHVNEILTDPFDDPESNYLVDEIWVTLPPIIQTVLRFNNTLLGRILIGPLVGQVAFIRAEVTACRAGDRAAISGWIKFIPSVAIVLLWLSYVGNISGLAYGVSCYLGLSILKIRTYIEHRAHEISNGRSVIVEDRSLLAFLFLNNNFHAVHHAHPNIAWYNLPASFHAQREKFLHQNNDFYFKNYLAVFSQFFTREKDGVAHPHWNLQNRSKATTGNAKNGRSKT